MTGKRLFIVLLVSLCTVIGVAAKPSQPEWKREMEKGDFYGHARMFRHALACYEKAFADPAIKDSVHIQLRLLKNLIDCYDISGDGKLLVQANIKLRELAKAEDQDAYMAMSDFMKGKHMHYQGSKDEGYALCLKSLELLKNSPCPQKERELALFYAALTRMYLRDGRYSDAMRMSDLQEKVARQIQSKDQSRQRALYRVYAIRTNLFTALGRMDKADSCYAASQRLGVRDIIVQPDLIPYLRKHQMWQEILNTAQYAKKMIREDGDTCGLLMHLILRDEADALMGLERYQEATRAYKNSELINDTLGKQYSQTLISTVREAVMQEHNLARRNMFIVILVAGVVFLVFIIGILVYLDRVQRRRNKAMAHNIRKLMYYREQVLKHQRKEENVDETEQKEEEADPEKLRFDAMDRQIMEEKLFLNPDFGRDELMRLMGADKNNLATIIQRYAGTNVVGYVNGKRMEYAVLLMKEHPEYTFAAIGEACGIKNPATFIRNFRNAYDLTPSEYRKTLEELPPLNRPK